MLFVRSPAISLLSKRARGGSCFIRCSVLEGGEEGSRRSFATVPFLAHQRLQRRKEKKQFSKVVPTLEVANEMPLAPSEMDNASLLTLSALSHHGARCEVLKRHIMVVDEVPYEEAEKTFQAIEKSSHKGMILAALPYQIGIGASLTAAAVSFPMCFHLDTVHAFNEMFVTADVPEPKDLETPLEVGSWAWQWVEPLIGQASFVLLCLQFARAQFVNLGIKPFTDQLKRRRAQRLCREYPMYDPTILSDFCNSDHILPHR